MIDGCTRLMALAPGDPAADPAGHRRHARLRLHRRLERAPVRADADQQRRAKKTFPVGLLTFVSKFSVDWGQMMAAGVLALIPACLFFAVHPALSGRRA